MYFKTKTMTKKGILLFLVSLIVKISFAQTEDLNKEIQSFSLQDAQKYAIENSYSLKSSDIDVKIAEQVVKETVAIGLPQISATADYKNMLDIPVSLVPAQFFGGQPGEYAEVSFGTQHNASFGLTLSQLIFSGEYIIGMQATTIYKDISIKQKTKTEKEVKESVSKSYFLALVAQRNIENIDSTLKNIDKLLVETKEIYAQGFIDEISVDQLTLTRRNIELSRSSLERMKEVAYRLLKFQMGLDFETEIKLTNNLDEFVDLAYLNGLSVEDFNVEKHIDYEITELNVVVNQNLLKYEKSTYLPTLSGFLSYSKNGMNNNFGDLFSSTWFPTTVAGLQLNVPIFNSGSKRSKVSQSKLKLDQAEVIHQQTVQGLQTNILQKRSDLQTSLNAYMYQQENMSLSEKIYTKTLEKFKKGMASNMDLTQAQNQYLSTQAAYFSAMIELLNKKVELETILN